MFYKNKIADLISKEFNLNLKDIKVHIKESINNEEYDYTFPCFKLMKSVNNSPDIIAKELKDKFDYEDFERVENKGAYLNFYVNKGTLAKGIIKEVLREGADYGKGSEGKNKEVLVEIPSLNILKEITKSDILANLTGNSIKNLFKNQGYKVTKINFLGDYNLEICKVIVAYKKWGNTNKNIDDIDEVFKLYDKFHEYSVVSGELNHEVQQCLKLLENNNSEVEILRDRIIRLSLKRIKKNFFDFNLKECYFELESNLKDEVKDVEKTLSKGRIVSDLNGAKAIILPKYNRAPFIVYIENLGYTKQMARLTRILKYKERREYERIIFIDSQYNELYFSQILDVISYIDADDVAKYEYYGIGLVKVKQSNLKINESNPYDRLDRDINFVIEMVNEKNIGWRAKEFIEKTLVVNSTIFYYLMNSKNKNILFDSHNSLTNNIDGYIYIQNVYEKAIKVFSDIINTDDDKNYNLLITKEDKELVKILGKYKKSLYLAKQELDLSIICEYVLVISKKLEEYISIIEYDDASLLQAKLLLVKASCQVIKNSLQILGIDIIKMK